LTVYTQLTDGTLKRVLEAILITSGLLHFYYDGFIWKLGQADTKRGLDLLSSSARGGSLQPARARLALWRPQLNGVAHVVLLAIPIMLLGSLEMDRGRGDELSRARALAEAVPNNSAAQNNLGYQLLQHDETEQSMVHLRRAIELQPDLEEARENMGMALMQLSQEQQQAGRSEEAIASARQAVEYSPKDPNTYNNLGVQLGQAGRYEEARKEWQRTLEIDPSHPLARRNLDLLDRKLAAASTGG
jgi:Flp pilus assembly protein TadD